MILKYVIYKERYGNKKLYENKRLYENTCDMPGPVCAFREKDRQLAWVIVMGAGDRIRNL